MGSHKAQLITHPVRSRILTALMGRRLTAQQVAEYLPDVPLSSVYRHVRRLAEGGILEPVEEVRVNGTATKVYAVAPGAARIGPEDVLAATPAEHLSYFTTFLNSLGELHRAYLEGDGVDPDKDPVHSLLLPLHLHPEDYPEFMEGLRRFLEPWRARAADGNPRRVVFAHAMIPDPPHPEPGEMSPSPAADPAMRQERQGEEE